MMRPTSRLLFYQRMKPMKGGYVFRNRFPRTKEERQADFAGPEFSKHHVRGESGWSLSQQLRDAVYVRRQPQYFWGGFVAIFGLLFFVVVKYTNQDLFAQLPFPFGSNGDVASRYTSGGTYNWDDCGNAQSRFAQGANDATGGNCMLEHLQPERYELRLVRAETAMSRRNKELAEAQKECDELRMMLAK